jgi:hypothetical protein
LAEIAALIDRLVTVMRADYVKVWLGNPIDALEGRTPVEMIVAGRVQDVSRAIAAIEVAGAA